MRSPLFHCNFTAGDATCYLKSSAGLAHNGGSTAGVVHRAPPTPPPPPVPPPPRFSTKVRVNSEVRRQAVQYGCEHLPPPALATPWSPTNTLQSPANVWDAVPLGSLAAPTPDPCVIGTAAPAVAVSTERFVRISAYVEGRCEAMLSPSPCPPSDTLLRGLVCPRLPVLIPAPGVPQF